MDTITLGRTGLTVGRTGFGALPIQRVSRETAARLLLRAVDGGITFFDTARGYTDSEAKVGQALSGVRARLCLATKTGARDRPSVLKDIETSLKTLRTDYIDLLQWHNPSSLQDPDDPESAYAGFLEARQKGWIRFIGITSHRLDLARNAAESERFDTVQFPLSAISSPEDLALTDVCRKYRLGVIAMKPLCGGLLTQARLAFAALRRFDNVVPIWGIQRESELDEILALERDPPILDAAMMADIEKERVALAGDFCRACGYCQPCPADIPIPMAARMSLLLRRMPPAQFLTADWQQKMRRIRDCRECGQCRDRCPYHLNPSALLKKMLADYETFLAQAPQPI
jgi:aryl-alcohol dehydrogenase-like predicted oxidoreductase